MENDKPSFEVTFGCFKTLTDTEKDEIYQKKRSPATNNATKLWVNCLKEYLIEKNLPNIEEISNKELPNLLMTFFAEATKKNSDDINNPEESSEYKTQTLRCIRAALGRYFKEERGTDIIKNELFVKCNDMFKGLTNDKKKG